MTLLEKVNRHIADAMKAKNPARLAPLRMLKTALVNRGVERGRELEETEAQQVVASLVKQRRESVEQFRQGGRFDLVERESAEITVLEAYLPPAADPAQIERLVDEAIAETAATSPNDVGKVMKAVMPKFAGVTVDGRQVNEIVRRKLG